MTATPEEPRPGTFGSLDRRVERLEGEVGQLRSGLGDLDRRLALMEQAQKFSHETMEAHFKGIEAANGQNLAEIKAIGARFDAAMLAGTAAAGDIAATPAGRQVLERITAVEKRAEANEKRGADIDRKVWMAAGATSLAVLLITLIGPLVIKLLVP